MTGAIAVSTPPPRSASRVSRAARFRLDAVPDDALHAEVKLLTGRHNTLTAELLAHLAEVDARGIYRERACSSLYTYCVYELRLSEDEAQRRVRAARTARAFPVLFEMLADGAIHLTGLLLLAPHLTQENHAELLARARFRTKREIEHLIAEFAPRPDVPARIEPLGPRPVVATNLWQAFTASLRGPVRDLVPGVGAGEAPPAVVEDEMAAISGALDDVTGAAPAALGDATGGVALKSTTESRKLPSYEVAGAGASARVGSFRYRVEFTASRRYVELLEEARDLLQHQVPDRDVARVHELAMEAFVEQLRKRRKAATERPRHVGDTKGSAPARVADAGERSVSERLVDAGEGSAPERVAPVGPAAGPAAGDDVEGMADARDGSAPARVTQGDSEGSAPARVKRQRWRTSNGDGREHGSRDGSVQEPASRYVPAAIRREVWRRDGGRCTFEDSSGQRCRERAGLEIHHERAFALGGPTAVENLRLMCRAHNGLLAEREFGREHVERMRKERMPAR